MRTWERTRIVEACGSCNRHLEVGTPIQVIRLTGLSPTAARRIRCEGCADGPIDVEQLEAFDVTEEGRSGRRVPAALYEFKGVTRDLFASADAASEE